MVLPILASLHFLPFKSFFSTSCQFILTVLFALALQTYMWLLEFPKIEQKTEPSPLLWIQLPVWAREKDRPSLFLRLDLFFFYITLLEVNQVSVKHPLIFLSCLFAILLYILSPPRPQLVTYMGAEHGSLLALYWQTAKDSLIACREHLLPDGGCVQSIWYNWSCCLSCSVVGPSATETDC